MRFTKILFLYGFLLTCTTASPTPAASPVPLNSSTLASQNATLFPRGGNLSSFARDQAAKIFSGLHHFPVPPLTCRGSKKDFCEKTCRCNQMHVMYCGVFTDAEETAFYVTTQKSAKGMTQFRNQAMFTCKLSCRCDPDAKPRTQGKKKNRRGKRRKRPAKDPAQSPEHRIGRPTYSSLPKTGTSQSHALQPRTDADQSTPSLIPPESNLLGGDKAFRPTQCKGVNRVDCQKRCNCSLYGTVDCDVASTITYKPHAKPMEKPKTSDLVNRRAKHITDKWKEREREERARGKKARTDDLNRRSEDKSVNSVVPLSSPTTSNVQNSDTSPVPLSPPSGVEPTSRKEILLPAPAWLPPPRFARPRPTQEITCDGKDKPFCKDRCRCNPDGTLLCNKNFQAGLQSLVGVAERGRALGLLMRQMAGVVAKCGLVCHCGDGIVKMGPGTIGMGEGAATRAGAGGVGVGPTFRTKMVGREGMTHEKAIAQRTDEAAPSSSAALNPSTSILSSLPPSMVVNKNSAASSSGTPERFPPVTCDSKPQSNQFCTECFFCTTDDGVSCQMLEATQMATLFSIGLPSKNARFSARLLTQDATKGCASICDCPEKGDASGRKSLERSTESLFFRFSDVSAFCGSTLQPRNGVGSSTGFPSLGLPTFNPPPESPTGLTCMGLFMDKNFCDTRCRCTYPFRTVVCDKLAQFQIDYWKKQKMPQAKLEPMVERWTQQFTERCAAICSCPANMSGNKRKKGEMKRSLSPPLSPPDHSFPAASTLQPRTDASSATKMPVLVRFGSTFKEFRPSGLLRCSGHDPRGLDKDFCEDRCQCTPAGMVDCGTDSRKKIAELVKNKLWSRMKAETMRRKVDAVITDECKAICICNPRMGSRPEKDSTRKTLQRPPTSPRPDPGPRDVSPISPPVLHPRSGLVPPRGRSSCRRVRITSPSVKKPKYPETGMFIECYTSVRDLLINCQDRCYCTSSGLVKCDWTNEKAIDEVTGSITDEAVVAKDLATLLVNQYSNRMLATCEPICCCFDAPGLGVYKTLMKTGMGRPKDGQPEGGSSGSGSPRGIIIEYRDLSHSAIGHLQPRSDPGFSTPKKGAPRPPPALNVPFPLTCPTSNLGHGWNARHCQERCYCTIMGEITCDIGAMEEIAGLTHSMELTKAKEFVSSNRKTIASECIRLCHCVPEDRARKDIFYSPIRYHATARRSSFQRRSGTGSFHSGPPNLPATSAFQPGYAFRPITPTPPLKCDNVAFRTKHCKERCQCTSGRQIFCTGSAAYEIVTLSQTLGQKNAIEFVDKNRRTIEKECGEICTCKKLERPKCRNRRSILPVNVSPNPSVSTLSHMCPHGKDDPSEPKQEIQVGITGFGRNRIQARSGAGPVNQIPPAPSSPVEFLLGHFRLKCRSDENQEALCKRRCFCNLGGEIKCDVVSKAMLFWMMRPEGSQGKSNVKPQLAELASTSQQKITQECKAACSCEKLTLQALRNEPIGPLISQIETQIENLKKIGIQPRSDSGHPNSESLPRPPKSTTNTDSAPPRVLKCWGAQTSECRRRCDCKAGGTKKDIDCDIDAEAKLQRMAAPGGSMKTAILPQLIAQVRRRKDEITKECQIFCICMEDRPYRSFRTSHVNFTDPQFQVVLQQYQPQPGGSIHPGGDLHPRSDVAPSTPEGLSPPPTSPPTAPSNKAAMRMECNDRATAQKCQHHCDCTTYGAVKCHKNGPLERLKSDEGLGAVNHDAATATAEGSKTRITNECIAACTCRNNRKSLAATLSSLSLNSKSITISKTKGKSKSGGRGERLKRILGGAPGSSTSRALFPRSAPAGLPSSISSPPSLTCAPKSPLTIKCLDQCRCARDFNIICDLNFPVSIAGFRLLLPSRTAAEKIRMYTKFMSSICAGPCQCGSDLAPRIAVKTTDFKVSHLRPESSLNPIQRRGSPDRGTPDISSAPAAPHFNLMCSGSESRYCEHDCYCSGQRMVKCDRILPPVITAFKGSMTTERAEIEQRRFVSDMENLCGHICQCVEPKIKAVSVLEHSHAIRPRSAAGPSSPVSPTIATAGTLHGPTFNAVCTGSKRPLCEEHCYCDTANRVFCDRNRGEVARSFRGIESGEIIQNLVSDWLLETTTTCRSACRCGNEQGIPSTGIGKGGKKRKATEQLSRSIQPRSGVGPSSPAPSSPGPSTIAFAGPSHETFNPTCTGSDGPLCGSHCYCDTKHKVQCNKHKGLMEGLSRSAASKDSIQQHVWNWLVTTCRRVCRCGGEQGSPSQSTGEFGPKRKAIEQLARPNQPRSIIQPRSDAGPSASQARPPARVPKNISHSGGPPACTGDDTLTCTQYCICNEEGVVVCEKRIHWIAAMYLKTISLKAASLLAKDWIARTTETCRGVCHCAEGSGGAFSGRTRKATELPSRLHPRSDAGSAATDFTSLLPATSNPQAGGGSNNRLIRPHGDVGPSTSPARAGTVVPPPQGLHPPTCDGPDSLMCLSHCSCSHNGEVVCEQKILRIAAKYLQSTIPERADRFAKEWIKKVTPQCSAICHCGEGSGEIGRNRKAMKPHGSIQARSAAGPSAPNTKPPLNPQTPAKKTSKIAKPTLRCGAEDIKKEIWCHDRCQCGPEGRIVCTKKAPGAIEALTGTPSPRDGIIITKQMAEEYIERVSMNVAGLCSEICDCGKGPRGDVRERWKKQHRGGRNPEEFVEYMKKPFSFSEQAAKDTAWTGKTKAQRDLLLSIPHGSSPQVRSGADVSTTILSNPAPKSDVSSIQRRTAGGPSMYVGFHIECIDRTAHTCERSCYCTPEGTIACNKNSATAVKALTGTKVGTTVITAEMAEESVAAGANQIARKCEGFCHCADGPSKSSGGVYERWKSRQRGSKATHVDRPGKRKRDMGESWVGMQSKAKKAAKATENMTGIVSRSFNSPFTSKGSSRTGSYSPSPPNSAIKPSKQMVCVDPKSPKSSNCAASCHCDPISGEISCDRKAEKAMTALISTKLPSGKIMTEEVAAARVKAEVTVLAEKCSQVCYCVDKPGKSRVDKHEQWIQEMHRGRKNSADGGYSAGHNPRSLPVLEVSSSVDVNTTNETSPNAHVNTTALHASPKPPADLHPRSSPQSPSSVGSPGTPLTSLRTLKKAYSPGSKRLECLNHQTNHQSGDCYAKCYCLNDGTIACNKHPLTALNAIMSIQKADGTFVSQQEAEERLREKADRMAIDCADWCFCIETPRKGPGMWGNAGRRGGHQRRGVEGVVGKAVSGSETAASETPGPPAGIRDSLLQETDPALENPPLDTPTRSTKIY
ncbi:hypothetical protein MMC30_003671 [Trapelia coarctata]|nr:hypothetical protein [Trapelia coarctata]